MRGDACPDGCPAGQDEQAAEAARAAAGELARRGAGGHVAAHAQEGPRLGAALHGLARDAHPGLAALPASARQPHLSPHLLFVNARDSEAKPSPDAGGRETRTGCAEACWLCLSGLRQLPPCHRSAAAQRRPARHEHLCDIYTGRVARAA